MVGAECQFRAGSRRSKEPKVPLHTYFCSIDPCSRPTPKEGRDDYIDYFLASKARDERSGLEGGNTLLDLPVSYFCRMGFNGHPFGHRQIGEPGRTGQMIAMQDTCPSPRPGSTGSRSAGRPDLSPRGPRPGCRRDRAFVTWARAGSTATDVTIQVTSMLARSQSLAATASPLTHKGRRSRDRRWKPG
jgi:hypothetical protein